MPRPNSGRSFLPFESYEKSTLPRDPLDVTTGDCAKVEEQSTQSENELHSNRNSMNGLERGTIGRRALQQVRYQRSVTLGGVKRHLQRERRSLIIRAVESESVENETWFDSNHSKCVLDYLRRAREKFANNAYCTFSRPASQTIFTPDPIKPPSINQQRIGHYKPSPIACSLSLEATKLPESKADTLDVLEGCSETSTLWISRVRVAIPRYSISNKVAIEADRGCFSTGECGADNSDDSDSVLFALCFDVVVQATAAPTCSLRGVLISGTTFGMPLHLVLQLLKPA
ncbi:hypothetical protein WN51_13716 [Melipona quadrifasciata]|uniref:Uncharacterized protein n=1 Tax=Melipona quadrifasciata TaxID=166423 RepID=A0A0M9A122_9HYME|nr:hypothetical protein WN51_13716 [Melipona quadrifasciata]